MKKRRVEFYEENETTAGRRTYDVHDCSNKCWNFSICIHTRQKWWKQMSPQKQKAAKRQLKK